MERIREDLESKALESKLALSESKQREYASKWESASKLACMVLEMRPQTTEEASTGTADERADEPAPADAAASPHAVPAPAAAAASPQTTTNEAVVAKLDPVAPA